MALTLRPTRKAWLEVALGDLDATLSDHFHCERKAAASALALVRSYPHRADLVRALTRLAHEETSHLIEVASQIRERGTELRRDCGDLYAARLRQAVRAREPERQLDLLLVCGLIEARSAERLASLGEALAPPLSRMYQAFAAAEERHRDLFFDLARPLVSPSVLERRLAELCALEGEIVDTLPIEPRIH